MKERSEPAIDPDGVYALSPEVVSATFDDQIWLYHLNRGRTLSLNRTAGMILELMDGRRSTAEIRELSQRAYPESAKEIGRDVDRTLRYLLENDALDSTTRDAASSPAAPAHRERFLAKDLGVSTRSSESDFTKRAP